MGCHSCDRWVWLGKNTYSMAWGVHNLEPAWRCVLIGFSISFTCAASGAPSCMLAPNALIYELAKQWARAIFAHVEPWKVALRWMQTPCKLPHWPQRQFADFAGVHQLKRASRKIPTGLAVKPARPSKTCKDEEDTDTCGIKLGSWLHG